MNIRIMRFVDYYIGIPVCFFLTLLNYIIRIFRKRVTDNYSKILFIELPEMGSTILSYSAILKIKKNFPESELFFLVFKKNIESVNLLNIIPQENILTIRSNNLGVFIKDTLKNILFIRQKKIDLSVDMEIFSRFSVIFSYISGIKKICGFYIKNVEGLYRGNLLDIKVNYNYYYHISENYCALAEAVIEGSSDYQKYRIQCDYDIPEFRADDTIIRNLKNLIKNKYSGYADQKIILISPEAGELPLRGWPYKNYTEFISLCLKNHSDIIIIITGTEKYRYENRNLHNIINNERLIDFTGETGLKELIHLYTISSVLLTNDGGAAHFASLTDIKCFVFFGPETPDMYKPIGSNIEVLYRRFHCSPCLSAFNYRISSCINNLCVSSITAQTVYQKIKPVIQTESK